MNQFMGLILVNFLLCTSITQRVFRILLMLIPQIIGVLSLYYCAKYYTYSIYANIKNITFYVSN